MKLPSTVINELLQRALATPALAAELAAITSEAVSAAFKDAARHADVRGAPLAKLAGVLTTAAAQVFQDSSAVERAVASEIVAAAFKEEGRLPLAFDENGDLVLQLSEGCDFKMRFRLEDLLQNVGRDETRIAIESKFIDGMKQLREAGPQWNTK